MCLGVPGEILSTWESAGIRLARARFGAAVREICLELQPDAVPGDFVLVHVGFAISKIDRDEAVRAWEALGALSPAADPDAGPGSEELE